MKIPINKNSDDEIAKLWRERFNLITSKFWEDFWNYLKSYQSVYKSNYVVSRWLILLDLTELLSIHSSPTDEFQLLCCWLASLAFHGKLNQNQTSRPGLEYETKVEVKTIRTSWKVFHLVFIWLTEIRECGRKMGNGNESVTDESDKFSFLRNLNNTNLCLSHLFSAHVYTPFSHSLPCQMATNYTTLNIHADSEGVRVVTVGKSTYRERKRSSATDNTLKAFRWNFFPTRNSIGMKNWNFITCVSSKESPSVFTVYTPLKALRECFFFSNSTLRKRACKMTHHYDVWDEL